MRKSAIAASAVLATGLMGLGGTAFADSGTSASDTDGEDTTRAATQQDQADTNTQAGAAPGRSVVGLNVPVAADVHEGVANDLNAEGAARDAVHVGQTNQNPDTTTGTDDTSGRGGSGEGGSVTGGDAVVTEATANTGGHTGTDSVTSQATAVNVGDTVNNVVASATTTVDDVANVSGGLAPVQAGN